MKSRGDSACTVKRHLLVAVAVAAVALTACSSSAAGRTGQTESDSASQLALAQRRASQYESPPTQALSRLSALRTVPPRGKTIVAIYSPVPQGVTTAAGVAAAAKAVGWHYKGIGVDLSNPSTVVAAINQALEQDHADVINLQTGTEAEISSTFESVTRAGAIIVPINYSGAPGGPIPAEVAGSEYYRSNGAMLADWVAARSKGEARIVFADADSLPAFAALRAGFNSEMKAVCGGCSIDTVQLATDQILNAQGTPALISALQRDPGAGYLVTVDGELFPGLAGELSAAGLGSRIVIANALGDIQNQSAILQGKEAVTTGNADTIQGWLAVDAALRHVEGMGYPAGYGLSPSQLLTKSNASTWHLNSDFKVPANYEAIFEKLWHVGTN